MGGIPWLPFGKGVHVLPALPGERALRPFTRKLVCLKMHRLLSAGSPGILLSKFTSSRRGWEWGAALPLWGRCRLQSWLALRQEVHRRGHEGLSAVASSGTCPCPAAPWLLANSSGVLHMGGRELGWSCGPSPASPREPTRCGCGWPERCLLLKTLLSPPWNAAPLLVAHLEGSLLWSLEEGTPVGMGPTPGGRAAPLLPLPRPTQLRWLEPAWPLVLALPSCRRCCRQTERGLTMAC